MGLLAPLWHGPYHLSSGDMEACRGGTSAEEEGQGYCIDGHRGPLCQTCDQVSSSPRYFDKVLGICADCPDNKGRTLAVFLTPALGGLILIATLFSYQSGVGTTACKPDRTVVAMARRRCAVLLPSASRRTGPSFPSSRAARVCCTCLVHFLNLAIVWQVEK